MRAPPLIPPGPPVAVALALALGVALGVAPLAHAARPKRPPKGPAAAAPASSAPTDAAPAAPAAAAPAPATVEASPAAAAPAAPTAPTTAPPQEQRCQAAVLDLSPGEGVTVERARSLTEVITAEVGANLPQCSVLSRAEIRALVSFEVERQLSGCDASSCLSEIGEALGVDRVVLGTFSRIDSRSLVSLRLVDMQSMRVVRRVTDSFEGDDRDAIKWIAWLARRLAMDDESRAGPRPVVDKPRIVERRATLWRTLAWTGLGSGTVALALAGLSGGGAALMSSSLPQLKAARAPDRAQIDTFESMGPWLAGGANLGLYVGGALVAGGAVLFFAPGEELVAVDGYARSVAGAGGFAEEPATRTPGVTGQYDAPLVRPAQ